MTTQEALKLAEEELQGGIDNYDGCEINPSNYRHDDACNLNNGYVGLFQAIEAALAAIRAAQDWQPMDTWVEDWKPILRPHIIHGAMDVTRRSIFGKKQWLNGDMTTFWPDEAFAPYWMPLPVVPKEWMQQLEPLPAPPAAPGGGR